MRLKEYLEWKKLDLDIWWNEWKQNFVWVGKTSAIVSIQAIPFIILFEWLITVSPDAPPKIFLSIIIGYIASMFTWVVELLVWADYDNFKRYHPEKKNSCNKTEMEK